MNRENRLTILLILAAALFLRLLFLGRNNLWTDEAATLIQIQNAPFSINPPLYYLFLKGWTALLGTSEAVLRLPSAFFSTASVMILYLLAKKMFSRNIAVLSTAIMALSAFHLWYAQEARSYAMAVLLGLLSTSFLYNFALEGKNKDLGFFAAFSTLGLYTNYFNLPLLVSQNLYAFLFLKQPLRKKIVMLLPFFCLALRSRLFAKEWTHVAKGFWLPGPDPSSLLITFENFICGYSGTAILYGFCAFLALLTVLYGLLQIARKTLSKETTFLFFLSFVPILGIYLTSNVFFSVYLDRGLIVFSPYYYILLACALLWPASRILKTTLIASLFLASAISALLYFSNYTYGEPPYRHHIGAFAKKSYEPLAAFLKNERRENDLILFAFVAPVYPLYYYMGLPEEDFFSFSRHVYDPQARDTNSNRPFAKVYKNTFYVPVEEALKMAGKRNGRVLLIAGTFPRNGGLDDNSQRSKDFFDRHLAEGQTLNFDGIFVFIYENTAQSSLSKASKE